MHFVLSRKYRRALSSVLNDLKDVNDVLLKAQTERSESFECGRGFEFAVRRRVGGSPRVFEDELNTLVDLVGQVQHRRSNTSSPTLFNFASFDFRTPLHSVVGLLDVALPLVMESDAAELLQQALLQGRSMQLLLDDVTDAVTLHAGTLQVTNRRMEWMTPARACVELFGASTAGNEPMVSVTPGCICVTASGATDVRASPMWVLADRTRANQVLTNLLYHAYCTGRSRVSAHFGYFCNGVILHDAAPVACAHMLGVAHVATSMSRPSAMPTCDRRVAFVAVVNDGEPLTPEDLSRVWLPWSKQKKSADLGLSICAQLAELMGGCMCAASTSDGSGSNCFVFLLPEEPAEVGPDAEAAQPAADQPVQRERSHTAVVVDDNAANRLVASRFLQKLGFHTIIEAESGDRCLEELQSAKLTTTPDVVVLDWEMPGINGLELARALRRSPVRDISQVPLICSSGHASAGDGRRAIAAGCNAFLPKPFSITTLRNVLGELIPCTPSDPAPRSTTAGLAAAPATLSPLPPHEEAFVALRARLAGSSFPDTCFSFPAQQSGRGYVSSPTKHGKPDRPSPFASQCAALLSPG